PSLKFSVFGRPAESIIIPETATFPVTYLPRSRSTTEDGAIVRSMVSLNLSFDLIWCELGNGDITRASKSHGFSLNIRPGGNGFHSSSLVLFVHAGYDHAVVVFSLPKFHRSLGSLGRILCTARLRGRFRR